MTVDHDQEITRAKFVLGALALFIISGYFAVDEFRYVIWGKNVQASVSGVKAFTEPGRRGSRHEMVSVEYSFPSDSDGIRNEHDALPADWPISGNTVLVQYVPGVPDSSRVAGHRSMGSVYVFLGSLALIGGFLLVLYREAKTSERRPVRRSR